MTAWQAPGAMLDNSQGNNGRALETYLQRFLKPLSKVCHKHPMPMWLKSIMQFSSSFPA